MGSYKLSAEARDDITEIYFHGLREFGETQADRYYGELFEKFQEIADHPLLYQAVDHVRPGYRRAVCKSNSIYYGVAPDSVEIMRIVGRQSIDDWQ